MIAEIASEIRSHYDAFEGERLSFKSSHRYEGKLVNVTFLQFKSELGPMNVISLELSDGSGHSAEQDLLMETSKEMKSKLMRKEFNSDLVKCLETLSEAIEEMI